MNISIYFNTRDIIKYIYTYIYQGEGVPERLILIPGCVGIGGWLGDGVCLLICLLVPGWVASDPP